MEKITVTIKVHAPRATVWKLFTEPEHVIKWNQASDDWHTPSATNDLRVGSAFTSRMESRDGVQGFDFSGTYTEVVEGERYAYSMADGRTVQVSFTEEAGVTEIVETFDAETENSLEQQRAGWQAILGSFKKYAEESIG